MAKDIRNTPAANILEQYFDEIAQGNRGDADIELLELEGSTLRYKVKIRHHQVGRVRIPFNGTRNITIYSLTTHVKGKVDITNPDPDDQKICVNSPVGEICATLTDVIKAVAGAL